MILIVVLQIALYLYLLSCFGLGASDMMNKFNVLAKIFIFMISFLLASNVFKKIITKYSKKIYQ